jgi:hypothetical protein
MEETRDCGSCCGHYTGWSGFALPESIHRLRASPGDAFAIMVTDVPFGDQTGFFLATRDCRFWYMSLSPKLLQEVGYMMGRYVRSVRLRSKQRRQ